MAQKKATRPAVRIPRAGEPLISEQEIAFCHYMLGHDAAGKRRALAECASMAGLEISTDEAQALGNAIRVREYCAQYSTELARQMARHESMRRVDYELSPMAVAGELLYILKHGRDERAQVAAGAKLLDWFGPLEERFKTATQEEMLYLATHGRWPDERLLAKPPTPPVQSPPEAVGRPKAEVLSPAKEKVYDF